MPKDSMLLGASMRRSGWYLRQHGWSNWLHASPCPAMVWIFLVFGLLWAFHQVTSGIVQQSELRLQLASEYNKITWQCNSMRGQIERKKCLAQRTVMASAVPVREL